MKKLLLAVALLGGVSLMAACNTVDGAGEDIDSAADAVGNELAD